MRTCCANCGMIYDIPVSDMDIRTPIEVSQSGVCPRCGSNAHNPISVTFSSIVTFNDQNEKQNKGGKK